MKKLLLVFAICSLCIFAQTQVLAQNEEQKTVAPEKVDTVVQAEEDTNAAAEQDKAAAAAETEEPAQEAEETKKAAEPTVSITEVIKDKFVDGGVEFMSIILVCLILGLAVAIERVISLNLSTTNVKKLLSGIKEKLSSEGVEGAREYCAKIPGPVASIFAQGLLRRTEGIDMVEKSIESYGSVEMGKLERGIVWISLAIAIAPMFGFMGTVIGMIEAFEQIEASEDIKISEIAGGIKKALLTTVAGLIVAVILQIFYNYCISKIDAIVNQMEEASISLVDMLIADDIQKNR